MRKLFLQQKGFTIIEMLVSLGIFTLVITVSVGSLLVLIAGNQQTQERSNTISSVSFVLDSMTRDIRTGTDYHCIDSTPSPFDGSGNIDDHELFGITGEDCDSGDIGVSFIETGGSLTELTAANDSRVAFFFDDNKIWRQIGDTDREQISSAGIFVHEAVFYVTGSERLMVSNSDIDQPMVTIFMQVSDIENSGSTCDVSNEQCVWIQTTVTQRLLDI